MTRGNAVSVSFPQNRLISVFCSLTCPCSVSRLLELFTISTPPSCLGNVPVQFLACYSETSLVRLDHVARYATFKLSYNYPYICYIYTRKDTEHSEHVLNDWPRETRPEWDSSRLIALQEDFKSDMRRETFYTFPCMQKRAGRKNRCP